MTFCRSLMLLILFASLGEPCFAKKSAPITLLDMRYTLNADLKNRYEAEQVWEELHAISTLQGVVNRSKPQLYINYIIEGDHKIDQYWWNMYRQEGEWLCNRDTLLLNSVDEAISYYASQINGAVVYDPQVAATSNIASAIAGIENLIAIRYDIRENSLYQRIIAGGIKLPVKVWLVNKDGSPLFTGKGFLPKSLIPSTGSIKNDPYHWFIEHYMKTGRCNTEYAGYYIDQKWLDNPTATAANHHTLTNHDFFVSKKAFFFDLSPWGDEPATDDQAQRIGCDLETLKTMLLLAYQQNNGKKMCYIGGFPAWAFKYTDHVGGRHQDVPTEWEFSQLIGAYNAFKDADAIGYGALANASFWTHFPLEKRYPQKWVTKKELRKRGYLKADSDEINFDGRQFMIFYVGDYDASSWVAQRTPSIWDDKTRGSVPMMWSISPVLSERVPMALHYYRKSATKNDYFAAADNGAGYLNPGMLQTPRPISGLPCGLQTWAKHCKKYYTQWGLSITGFVIDGFAPALSTEGLDCYASFSPNGIVPQKVPLTLLHGEMPIIRSDEDINPNSPQEAAQRISERVNARSIPFHWFRNILKTPSWYKEVVNELKQKNPQIELLDAPIFFALYKIYLQQNPLAADGKIE